MNTAALKSQLLNNVDADPAVAGITSTGGRLDVDKAIRGCAAPPTPDFTLSVSPTSQSVAQGQSTSYTVGLNRTGGFSGSVSLSVSGLPTGASSSFSPNPATGTLVVIPPAQPDFTLSVSPVATGRLRQWPLPARSPLQ